MHQGTPASEAAGWVACDQAHYRGHRRRDRSRGLHWSNRDRSRLYRPPSQATSRTWFA